jgi:hypothetical protein
MTAALFLVRRSLARFHRRPPDAGLRVWGLTRDIIRIESITGAEGTIQDYLAARTRAMGLEVDVFEFDLAALAARPAFHPMDAVRMPAERRRHHARQRRRPIHSVERPRGYDSRRAEDRLGQRSLLSEIKARPHPWPRRLRHEGRVTVMTMAVEIIRDLGLNLKGDLILEYVMTRS